MLRSSGTAERGELHLVDTEMIRQWLETAALFAVALEAMFTLDTKHSAMATGSALHLSRSWRTFLGKKKAQGTGLSPHSHGSLFRSRPGWTTKKLPWIQTGCVNLQQFKGTQWNPKGDERMAAVVGVIVSWLEHEVTATAPNCFNAPFFF